MKQAIIYLILFIAAAVLNCSSKQETKSGASDNSTVKSTEKLENGKTTRENITFLASDGVKLSAYYYFTEGAKEEQQPLVVLIHQFRESKDQWPQDFVDGLLNSGYKVFAYDIRGHGNSAPVDYDLTDLLWDSEKAPKDVDGVFTWAKEQKGIDASRISVIGTSIGGNLACYAKFSLDAKTVIAISNGASGFENLNKIDPKMLGKLIVRITDVLIITGIKDGSHEKDAKYIMDNYVADPQELVVIDSDRHGIVLMIEHPEIYTTIYNWLKKYL